MILQGELYEFVLPLDPWVPVGNAAQLAGIALLLLAIAVGMVPLLMAGPRAGWLTLLLSGTMGIGGLPIAATTWFSGQAGHVVTVTGLDVSVRLFAFGWPVLLLLTAMPLLRASAPRNDWLLITIALLIASTPIPSYFITSMVMGYTSHDTTPWDEAVVGMLLVGAATAWWLASRGLPCASASTRRLEVERCGALGVGSVDSQ